MKYALEFFFRKIFTRNFFTVCLRRGWASGNLFCRRGCSRVQENFLGGCCCFLAPLLWCHTVNTPRKNVMLNTVRQKYTKITLKSQFFFAQIA